MKKALAIWLLAGAVFTANGQSPAGGSAQAGSSPFQLSGRVIDSTGFPLSHATVEFITASDTVSLLTSDNGNFTFRRLTTRIFRLNVSMKGYQAFSRSFDLAEDKTVLQLAAFTLYPDYLDLDPVTVTRIRPVTINGDTVSYNTAAFPVRDGAEVEDILKRLPGVEVDMDGNVIVQGKKLEKVLVNGKEFFGGDVLLAIRNLPADVVDKLQVIDDYGDKARLTGIKSGDPAKVLNIVLKPDKRNGIFGHVQAGAGNDDKYAEDAFGNAFHGDRQLSMNGKLADESPTGKDPSRNVELSYADQWDRRWSGGFNAGAHSDAPQSSNSMEQQSYYPGQQIDLQQSTANRGHNQNDNGGGVLTFKPDGNSTLRITPSFGGQQSDQQSIVNSSTVEQDSGFSKTTKGLSNNQTSSHAWNAATDLYFERIMPASKRRFSMQTSVAYSDSRQLTNNQSTTSIITDSLPSQSLLHYLGTNSTTSLNINFNSNYFQPVGANGFLELGYIAQSSLSRTDRITRSPDSLTGALVVIDSLSLAETYQTLTQQLHAGYSAKFQRLNLSTALDGQPGLLSGNVDSKGDRYSYRYFSVLPRVEANWKLTPSKTLLLRYRGSSTPPGLQQVSPVTDLTNPQYPVTGNPDLKPSYTHNGSMHFEKSNLQPTQFSGYGIGIGYTLTLDPILPSIVHPKDSSQVIQTTTYVNAGRNTALYADYHYTLPAFLNKRLRITGSGSLGRSQSLTLTDGQTFVSRSVVWNQGLHLQLLIPDVLEMTFQANYSLSHTAYSSPSQLPGTVQTAGLVFSAKHYILSHWSLSYWINQPYTSMGSKLQPAPASLTANLRREFLPHNKAAIAIAGYNLLNSSAAVGQSVSTTTITQTQTNYIGRYFLVTFTLKLQRFHQ